MASLGDLVARAVLDLGAWSGPMAKAEKEAQKFGNEVEKSFNDLGKKVGTTMLGIGASLLGVHAIMGAFTDAINVATELTEMAEATGEAVESLDQMALAASLAGGDMETFAKFNKELTKTLVEAQNPASKMGQAFAALGMDAKKLSEMKMEDRIAAVAEQFNAMPEGIDKTNLAIAMFGKAGDKALVMMKEWPGAMEDAKKQTDAFGVTSEAVGNQAKAIGDNAELLSDGLRRSLYPAMESVSVLSGQLVAAFQAFGGESTSLAGGIGTILTGAVRIVVSTFILLSNQMLIAGQALGGLSAAFVAFVTGDFKGAKRILDDMDASIEKIGADTQKALKALWSEGEKATAQSVKTEAQLAAEAKARKAAADAAHRANQILNGSADASKKAADEAKKHAEAIEKVTAKWQAFINVADDPAWGGLQKELADLNKDLKDGLIPSMDLYYAAVDRIAKKYGDLKTKEVADEFKDMSAAVNKAYDAALAFAEEMTKEVKPAEDLRDAMKEQAEAFGKTAYEIEQGNIAKRKQQALDNTFDEGVTARVTKIYDEAAAWAAIKEQNRLAQEQASLWQGVFETADRYAESFVVGLGNGLGNLSDMVKKVALDVKQYLLKALYELTLRPFVVSIIGTAAGAAGVSNQAMASVGGITGQGGASSLFSGGSGFFGLGEITSPFGATGAMGPPSASGAMSMTWGGMAGAGLAGAGIGMGVGSLGAAFLGNGRNETGMTAGGTAGGLVGGIVGSIFPVVGTIVGSLIGSVIGTALGSLFSKGGGEKIGGEGGTGTLAGLSGWTPNANDAAMLSLATATQASYKGVAGRLGVKGLADFYFGGDMDPEGTASNRFDVTAAVGGKEVYHKYQGNLGRDPATMEAEMALEAKRAVLAALQATEMPALVQSVLSSVDAATASEATIDRIEATAIAVYDMTAMLDAMVDPVKAVNDALSAAGQTKMEAWTMMGAALHDLANTVPATAEGLNTLNAATGDYYTATLQLVAGIMQAKDAMTEMFGATRKTIADAFLTPEQKLAREQGHLTDLISQLDNATDPATIQKLTDQINASMNAVWGMLKPEDQRAQQADFLLKLDKVQSTATTKLDASLKAITEQTKSDRDFLTDKVTTIVNAVVAAGGNFNAGANTIATTAAKGVAVDVTVHVQDERSTAEVN